MRGVNVNMFYDDLNTEEQVSYLIKPILQVLQEAGGQLERSEIRDRISELDEHIAEFEQKLYTSNKTGNQYKKFDFKFNFAIKELSYVGLISYVKFNPKITLTQDGANVDLTDFDVKTEVRDLLKGEQKMKSYYDYLEESTNVVKSNANRNKIITILSYLLIWAFAMIVFWFFTSGSDAMGYSLMFLWFILPISTFIVSIVIGKNNFWGKGKWAFTLFFGVMYMLAEYGTFKMANNIAFNKLNAPDLGMIVAGAIISAIGMLVGSLWNKKRHNQKNN